MRNPEPVNLLLYKWRYAIGYAILTIILVGAIALAGLYAPGGVTQAEIETIAQTNQLHSGELSLVNIPLHALQALSFMLLGVSHLSIKLPAMLLAIGAITAIFFLLRRWFKSSITILTMLIMATTSQLIFLAQSATPSILYVLHSALILLFSSLILQKASRPLLWKGLLAASVGLSMYTPFFAYINVGLLIAALIHPRTRYHLFRKSQRVNWTIAGAIFIATIAPLLHFAIQDPALAARLTGIHQITSTELLPNLAHLVTIYFGLTPTVIGSQIAPIFDFASIFIIILGILTLFRHSYTARSYIITAWLLLTTPILLINPGLIAIIAVPLFILLAIGIETLLNEWYKLFPKNPYARSFGLIMAVGLIGVMVFSGIDRFTHGYRHMPEAAARFTTDIRLLQNHLNDHPVRTQLVAAEEERPLFEAYATHSDLDIIVSNPDDAQESTNILVTNAARQEAKMEKASLVRVITNDRRENADRFYLYKAD